jgi:hypothetical protein
MYPRLVENAKELSHLQAESMIFIALLSWANLAANFELQDLQKCLGLDWIW